jgi:hypothetical protein
MFRWIPYFALALCAHAAQPYLLLGPMVGHVGDGDARIWARASGPAQFSVLIGSKEDLSDGTITKGPKLGEEAGFMANVWVAGLKPGSRYYYCVLLVACCSMANVR